MSPLAQSTELAHGGGVDDDVTEGQLGSPDRLRGVSEVNELGEWHELPYGRDIPSSPNSGLADSGTQEAVPTCYHNSSLQCLCHLELVLESDLHGRSTEHRSENFLKERRNCSLMRCTTLGICFGPGGLQELLGGDPIVLTSFRFKLKVTWVQGEGAARTQTSELYPLHARLYSHHHQSLSAILDYH